MSEKHLFKFQTENDYKTAKRNNLIVPNISMVVEDGDTYINSKFVPRELAEAGDIIVYHIEENGEKTVKYMKPQAYNANDGYWIPDAIVVVPYSHTDDGTVRAMGLKYASTITPSEGTDNLEEHEYITFGGNDNIVIDGVKQYNSFFCFSSIEGQTIEDTIGTVSELPYCVFPTDTLIGHSDSVLNPFDNETAYINKSTNQNVLPSPYNNDGSACEAYHSKGEFSTFASKNVFEDMDGDKNTLAILKMLNQDYLNESLYANVLDNATTKEVDNVTIDLFPMASACARYSSVLKPCSFDTAKGVEENITTMPWYLPSAGELGYMRSRMAKISYARKKLNLQPYDSMPTQMIGSSTCGIYKDSQYQICTLETTYLWPTFATDYYDTSSCGVFPFCKF